MENTFEESTRNGNGGEPRDPYSVIRHEAIGDNKQILNAIMIDKNVPIPQVMCGRKPRRNRSNIEVALLSMEVGDSIHIPDHLVNPAKSALNVFARLKASKKQSKGAKYQFVTRRVERNSPVFRVWRVK